MTYEFIRAFSANKAYTYFLFMDQLVHMEQLVTGGVSFYRLRSKREGRWSKYLSARRDVEILISKLTCTHEGCTSGVLLNLRTSKALCSHHSNADKKAVDICRH